MSVVRANGFGLRAKDTVDQAESIKMQAEKMLSLSSFLSFIVRFVWEKTFSVTSAPVILPALREAKKRNQYQLFIWLG